MNGLFPDYLTHQAPWLFLLHFCFVGLVFLGQYFLCRFIQERGKIFGNVALESFLFVPFFLFPLGLFFSWLHWGNFFYGGCQILFISFALLGIYKYRTRFHFQFLRDVSGLEWLCYGVIFILCLFGWLVPIPDNYNGHGHILWNVLTRMLNTGSFDFLGRSDLSSDDNIQLFFPTHFTYWLRFYCLPHSLFFYRSALLIPMIVGFFLVQTIKDICRIFNFPKEVGLLGFLAIAGTTFNAFIFYEIQYDTLALLMLLYSFHLLAKILVKQETVFPNLFLLLCFSFVIRTQIFIILFFSTSLLSLFYWRRLRPLLKLRPLFLLAGFLPLFLWFTIAWVKYGHPLWPQSRGAVERVFKSLHLSEQKQPMIAVEELPIKIDSKDSKREEGEKNYGARVRYFLELFDHHFPNSHRGQWGIEKLEPTALFLIRAGPLSLITAFLFFFLLLLKKMERPAREFLILEGFLLCGWVAEYLLFYIGHNKFPQYLSAVTLFPAGLVFYSLQKRFFRPLPVVLAIFLFLSFNSFLFGHRNVDFHFSPLKILFGRKTFIEKIAYKSNKTGSEIEKEAVELYQAYNSGKRILHIEVEPGGLLPSLMGREFLGKAYYFTLVNYSLRDAITAKSKEDFVKALERRKIGFIFIPQRDHETLERHPLFKVLRKLKQEGRYHLLVPVEAVHQQIRYVVNSNEI